MLGSGTVDPRKVKHDYLTQPPMDISKFGCPSKRYHSIVQVSQEVLPTAAEAPILAYPQFHCRPNQPVYQPESECSEEEEEEDVGNERPACSYIDMIRRALKSSDEGKMKLKEIYGWITSSYPYFSTCRLQWKVNRLQLIMHQFQFRIQSVMHFRLQRSLSESHRVQSGAEVVNGHWRHVHQNCGHHRSTSSHLLLVSRCHGFERWTRTLMNSIRSHTCTPTRSPIL